MDRKHWEDLQTTANSDNESGILGGKQSGWKQKTVLEANST